MYINAYVTMYKIYSVSFLLYLYDLQSHFLQNWSSLLWNHLDEIFDYDGKSLIFFVLRFKDIPKSFHNWKQTYSITLKIFIGITITWRIYLLSQSSVIRLSRNECVHLGQENNQSPWSSLFLELWQPCVIG